jgi:hypothetical protein
MKKIIFLIVCLLSVSCSKPNTVPKTVTVEGVPMDSPRKSTRMTTVQHDGHWFLVFGEHFMHHVDCPCKKEIEK